MSQQNSNEEHPHANNKSLLSDLGFNGYSAFDVPVRADWLSLPRKLPVPDVVRHLPHHVRNVKDKVANTAGEVANTMKNKVVAVPGKAAHLADKTVHSVQDGTRKKFDAAVDTVANAGAEVNRLPDRLVDKIHPQHPRMSVEMQGLAENATGWVKKFAPLFDFDDDCCLPAPAISPNAKIRNPGLPLHGLMTVGGRDPKQFANANTYSRSASVTKDGHTYTFILYALYFEKDQTAEGAEKHTRDLAALGVKGYLDIVRAGYSKVGIGIRKSDLEKKVVGLADEQKGHRHDWEWAAVWLTDGELTHASYSAHGDGGDTKPIGQLETDGQNHVKVVYHRGHEGGVVGSTRSMRFATSSHGAPRNPSGKWMTPAVVDWDKLTGNERFVLGSEVWAKGDGGAHSPLSSFNFWIQIFDYRPGKRDQRPVTRRWRSG